MSTYGNIYSMMLNIPANWPQEQAQQELRQVAEAMAKEMNTGSLTDEEAIALHKAYYRIKQHYKL